MNSKADDLFEAQLREQLAAPVPDDGFCASVMDRLPSKRGRSQWPTVAGTLAGVATCSTSLWSAPIASDGWRDWLSGAPSESTLTMFVAVIGMAILALAWTITEADERCSQLPRRMTL